MPLLFVAVWSHPCHAPQSDALLEIAKKEVPWLSVFDPSQNRVTKLQGGLSNWNYIIWQCGQDGDKMVLRVFGDAEFVRTNLSSPYATVHLIDRNLERVVHELCAHDGISPRLLNSTSTASLSVFQEGRALEMRDQTVLERIVRLVDRFHRVTQSAPILHPKGQFVSPVRRATSRQQFLERLSRTSASAALGASIRALSPMQALLDAKFKQSGRTVSAIHSDITPANFLLDGLSDCLWLLDFAHVTLGDPLWDFGSIASLNSFNSTKEDSMIDTMVASFGGLHYWKCSSRVELAATIRLMRVLIDLQEASWGFAQAELSTIDFTTASWTGPITSFADYGAEWLAKVQNAVESGNVKRWALVLGDSGAKEEL